MVEKNKIDIIFDTVRDMLLGAGEAPTKEEIEEAREFMHEALEPLLK